MTIEFAEIRLNDGDGNDYINFYVDGVTHSYLLGDVFERMQASELAERDALRVVVEAARKYTDLSLSDEYCPNCLRRISDGHDGGCELDELAAALARVDGKGEK